MASSASGPVAPSPGLSRQTSAGNVGQEADTANAAGETSSGGEFKSGQPGQASSDAPDRRKLTRRSKTKDLSWFETVYPVLSRMDMQEEAKMLFEVHDSQHHFMCGFWAFKVTAACAYLDVRCQVLVALLIVANFIVNIIEKQVDPDRAFYEDVWHSTEILFNIIFAIELLWNMYGFWFRPFWSSGWNVFDFIVVFGGLLEYFDIGIPSMMRMMRTLRAFRVFRLFKRVKELQRIVVSLLRAVPGVLNAFLIMAIIMSIYAMLAVEFYREVGHYDGDPAEAYFNTTQLAHFDAVPQCHVDFITGRGYCYGEEYFGNFFKALYTLFQIQSGESWSECIARLAAFSRRDWELGEFQVGMRMKTVSFFVSYVVLTSIVLMNVVIAVLLDKMSSIEDQNTKEEEGEREQEASFADSEGQAEVLPTETRSEQQPLSAVASNQSCTSLEFVPWGTWKGSPELDDQPPEPWPPAVSAGPSEISVPPESQEASLPAMRGGGGERARAAAARQDPESSRPSWSKLSSLPPPVAPLLAASDPAAPPRRGGPGAPPPCSSRCTAELAAIRQELASARGQLEVLSLQVQALVARKHAEQAAARRVPA